MKKKSLIIIASTVTLLLIIPLLAMQFTDQVNWNLMDFVVAAILLFVGGVTIDFVLRKVKRFNYRIVVIVALVVIFLLVWAELAVGIFGTPLSGS